ncbi:MAG: hypothetical protein MZV64_22885 [Ignavibacteriales bacterium]|nr:hypothetical protein [Ignavibacteriales bacterium]
MWVTMPAGRGGDGAVGDRFAPEGRRRPGPGPAGPRPPATSSGRASLRTLLRASRRGRCAGPRRRSGGPRRRRAAST